MGKIYKRTVLQYVILIAYYIDFSYSHNKASSTKTWTDINKTENSFIKSSPVISNATTENSSTSKLKIFTTKDDTEVRSFTPNVLEDGKNSEEKYAKSFINSNLSSEGCGKRMMTEVSASRQIQMPRIMHEFDINTRNLKQTLIANRMETNGAWPWMAGIYTRNFGIENFFCNAVIIDLYHLLTAANCFGVSGKSSRRIKLARYVIRVGSIKVGEGDRHLVDKITVHPDYVRREYYNDIAIIRVKEPFQFEESSGSPNAKVQPICLPLSPELLRKGLKFRDLTVTGWGDQSFVGPRVTILQERSAVVIDTPTCDKTYLEYRGTSIPRGITNQFLCVGLPDGEKYACQRNPGEPLMLLKNDVWFLVGVASFNLQCVQADFPGVFTGITNYLDWIQEVTSAN